MAGSGPKPMDLKASAEEREATTNRAAYRHWLRAVHGLTQGNAALRQAFAGTATPYEAALLLEADLRPDDRIFLEGAAPDWLDQALQRASAATTRAEATVLVTDTPAEPLPENLRVVIQTAGEPVALPPHINLTRPDDWT
jgi:hypothetical protein